MWRMPERCPTCGGPLQIRELACPDCKTEIRGYFQPCDFCRLTEDEATFLRVFVVSRGSLKAVGQELGISYPTVRSKLEEIIAALSQEAERRTMEEGTAARREILDRIASGELSAAEGLRLLKATKAEKEDQA